MTMLILTNILQKSLLIKSHASNKCIRVMLILSNILAEMTNKWVLLEDLINPKLKLLQEVIYEEEYFGKISIIRTRK